jgi:hypothetical protein
MPGESITVYKTDSGTIRSPSAVGIAGRRKPACVSSVANHISPGPSQRTGVFSFLPHSAGQLALCGCSSYLRHG